MLYFSYKYTAFNTVKFYIIFPLFNGPSLFYELMKNAWIPNIEIQIKLYSSDLLLLVSIRPILYYYADTQDMHVN